MLIGRDTFTPTSGSSNINWSIAADGGTVGSFTVTASDDVFAPSSAGSYLTHFTFNLSFFQGQTGTVLGQRVAPTSSDLAVTILVRRYYVGV